MCKKKEENGFENIMAVTNRTLCSRPFAEQMERICQLHPAAILLREKELSAKEYYKLAEQVMQICESYEVPLILHSYPEVALKLSCRRLHLPFGKLKELAEKDKAGYDMLGCSIHTVAEAAEAAALGATYLTAGHIYVTDCKKGVPARGLDFLREVCAKVAIPVYAIGGIGLEQEKTVNGAVLQSFPNRKQMEEIYAQGAVGACIMSGMMRF
jgi:thiamine-phosphate pyrophosphorylase